MSDQKSRKITPEELKECKDFTPCFGVNLESFEDFQENYLNKLPIIEPKATFKFDETNHNLDKHFHCPKCYGKDYIYKAEKVKTGFGFIAWNSYSVCSKCKYNSELGIHPKLSVNNEFVRMIICTPTERFSVDFNKELNENIRGTSSNSIVVDDKQDL